VRGRGDDGGLELGAADLLIVDEAGQAPPAIATGLFALARRALVVGDVEQLKPIWGIQSPQDHGLLNRVQLDFSGHIGGPQRRPDIDPGAVRWPWSSIRILQKPG
jgi:hypothetical protein